jgi:opacity protein-like surface antigen
MNTIKTIALGLALFMGIGTGPVHAATPALQQGMWDLSLNFGMTPFGTVGPPFVGGGFVPNLGFFVTDDLEAIGFFSFTSGSVENDTEADVDLLQLGAEGRYNLPIGGPVVPYVGIGLALTSADVEGSETDLFELFISGGARYFITPTSAVGGNVGFTLGTGELNDEDFDLAALRLFVSYSLFLGK